MSPGEHSASSSPSLICHTVCLVLYCCCCHSVSHICCIPYVQFYCLCCLCCAESPALPCARISESRNQSTAIAIHCHGTLLPCSKKALFVCSTWSAHHYGEIFHSHHCIADADLPWPFACFVDCHCGILCCNTCGFITSYILTGLPWTPILGLALPA